MYSYYRRRVPGQSRSVITRPVLGLNEYNPSVSVDDNHITDMIDVLPKDDSYTVLDSVKTLTAGVFSTDANNDGIILEAIAIQGRTELGVSEEGYALLTYNKSTNEWAIKHAKDKVGSVGIDKYTLTGIGLPVPAGAFNPDMYSYNYSSANYSTDAVRYVCFTCEYTKKLIYYNYTDSEVGSTNLPFYPKKIISHVGRIFAIDTTNKIWWCRAGDIFSWYSIEYQDAAIMSSVNMKNGTYSIENQPDVTRPITVTVTQTNTADTLGTITIVGINQLGDSQEETITPSYGRVQTLKSFTNILSITGAGWTQGGATPDTITFGVAPITGGYVQNDAGFWTIEKENTLTDITIMSTNNLYIFAPDNIYVFRGYSPDTFTLNQVVTDLGIKQPSTPRKWITTINNTSYFFDNGSIYEFNGYDYPRNISKNSYVNGALTNGIMGGIKKLNQSVNLASDNDNLYIYDSSSSAFTENVYYVFDTDTRTWWKKSGFTINNSVYTSVIKVIYIRTASTDEVVSFVIQNTTAGEFDLHYELGHKATDEPYMVSKAYNTAPSETGTLTTVILQVKGVADTTSDIDILYSLTSNGDDFESVKSITDFEFNGDIQNIELPVPTAYIANAPHYRLKVTSNNYTEVYNIERRFRVRGYTR